MDGDIVVPESLKTVYVSRVVSGGDTGTDGVITGDNPIEPYLC